MISKLNINPVEDDRQFLHGGNVYANMWETGGSLDDVLDFSANINPLGLSAKVRQAILKSIDTIIHYPDTEGRKLKAAISSYYNVDQDFITLGNGAVELIYVLSHILKPRQALIPAPTFSEYQRAAQAAGARVKYFPLLPADGFSLEISRLTESEYMKETDLIFICNPNNPTGVLLKRLELIPAIEKAASKNSLVVIDESFIDFLADDSEYTCRPLLKQYPNLVIIQSLTKFFAIPGLRLGFALTSPSLAKALSKAKDPWNVNSLAQCAGVAALNDTLYQVESRKTVAEAQAELYKKLLEFPEFYPYTPSVNYIFLNIGRSGFSSGQLCRELAARRILIRDCSNYPGLSSDYIRVAVKLPEQNNILLSALRSVLG